MANGEVLSQATGFIVVRGIHPYLVTNYHVLAGRHPESGRALHNSLALPDSLYIAHHGANRDFSWYGQVEPLFTVDGDPRFLVHPSNKPGAIIDVAALPLTKNSGDDVHYYPVDRETPPDDMAIYPGMPVSIVGFPAGLRAGGYLPVWKTGHIASEPEIDFDGLPCFLIDATTRGGMSGSPVYLTALGAYPMKRGGTMIASAEVFMGIYASRVQPGLQEIEIGRVWKPHLIDEVIQSGG